MRRKSSFTGKILSYNANYTISFSEVDSMGVVWHGHYVRFLEYGREAWGKHYGMNYMDVYKQGYMIPVVQVACDYKAPLLYEDVVRIESRFHLALSAKMQFEYELFRLSDNKLVFTAQTTQVFIDAQNRELQIAVPAFFEQWINQWL